MWENKTKKKSHVFVEEGPERTSLVKETEHVVKEMGNE